MVTDELKKLAVGMVVCPCRVLANRGVEQDSGHFAAMFVAARGPHANLVQPEFLVAPAHVGHSRLLHCHAGGQWL